MKSYTQAQDSTYTIPLWRARLAAEDAIKKRDLDTLVLRQDSVITADSVNLFRVKHNFEDLLRNQEQKYKAEHEISSLESSLKISYLQESRKYRKQRNVFIGIAGLSTGIAGLIGLIAIIKK